MSSGGVVGLSNNARGKLIGGWVGINGSKAKLIKGWVGDENNKPKLIYTAEVVHGEQVFTSSGTFTVPSGVSKIDIFCVGGAGGNCDKSYYEATSGNTYLYNGMGGDHASSTSDCHPAIAQGGSGYTHTEMQVSVSSGETLTVAIGAKGTDGTGRQYEDGTVIKSASDATDGGTSGVYRGATTLCSASGGKKASSPLTATSSTPSSGDTTVTKGGDGGSGGRSAGLWSRKENATTWDEMSPSWSRDVHGFNGYDGGNATAYGQYENYYNGQSYSWTVNSSSLASGQGTTTKAFGESGGTQYDNFGSSGTVIIRW